MPATAMPRDLYECDQALRFVAGQRRQLAARPRPTTVEEWTRLTRHLDGLLDQRNRLTRELVWRSRPDPWVTFQAHPDLRALRWDLIRLHGLLVVTPDPPGMLRPLRADALMCRAEQLRRNAP